MTSGTSSDRRGGGRWTVARAVWCALLAAACLAGCGGDDEIVGLDRVGADAAPKQLRLQLNASFSPQSSTPAHAEGFRRLYTAWARRHPEWRIDLTIIPDSQGTFQQARLLEHAAHLAPGAPLRPPPRGPRGAAGRTGRRSRRRAMDGPPSPR